MNQVDSNSANLYTLLLRGFYTTAFQPVIETRTSKTVGYESLLRGPENTALANPGKIFRGQSGLPEPVLLNLDRMAIDSAVRTGRNLPESDLIFINILCKTLLEVSRTLDEFLSVLAELQIDTSRIVFELSESTGREGTGDVLHSLLLIRKAGIRLALDDIGVRSPYLYHLLMLEPEFIKLDLIFIKGIDRNPRKQDLVHCMVVMADRMGSRLIAEGVETTTELEVMKNIGVPLVQGFLFGRPQAAEYWCHDRTGRD